MKATKNSKVGSVKTVAKKAAKPVVKSAAEFEIAQTEYNGHPIFNIRKPGFDINDRNGNIIAFGPRKAKMILAAIDDIQAFVDANDNGE